MSLLLTEDQQQLAEAVRELVNEQSDLTRVRQMHDSAEGYDHRLWAALVEMGAAAVLIPEEFGGLSMGLTEASLVLEHAGALLAPVPLYSCLLGAALLQVTDDFEAKEQLLPAVASGEQLVVPAFTEGAGSWIPAQSQVSFDGEHLHGVKSFVLEGQLAHQYLVLAREADQRVLVLVEADGPGIVKQPLGMLDRSMRACRIEFSATPARKLAVTDVDQFLDQADALASVLLASSQYGAYLRSFEVTLQYAKDRVQFGRSIGSFQAIKHALAEWAMEAELSYAMLRNATVAGDHSGADFTAAAIAVQVKMQSVVYAGASWMARIHGGIGYTWEHNSHLYLKNAKATQVLLGTPGARLETLAQALNL